MPPADETELRNDGRFVALQAEFQTAFEVLTSKLRFDGLNQDAAVHQAAWRFRKLLESASGPVFDEAGYLPPMMACTEAEVARWFGSNTHRWALIDRIRTWISLSRAVAARRFLLDGSFVTAKEQPGDVDAVVLVSEDFDDQLRAGKPEAVRLLGMARARKPKELFLAEDEEAWWGWVEFFGRTREANGRRKGLIKVIL